jgi:hypothetical protein
LDDLGLASGMERLWCRLGCTVMLTPLVVGRTCMLLLRTLSKHAIPTLAFLPLLHGAVQCG